MPKPRKLLVCIEDTPYYHVVSRCVRRAFLCGRDKTTNQSYEHRRAWIEERIRLLSSLFAIDVCSYAVMSNHYHIVLKLCPEQASKWTEKDIILRWHCLHKGTLLTQKYLSESPLQAAEWEAVKAITKIWSKRLCDMSWFMKCLNEPLARIANREDKCTGHFWEARFHCDPLLTDSALLAAMAYVDLNPIRAKMADRPENSAHTSIQERINPKFNVEAAIKNQQDFINPVYLRTIPIKPLALFEGSVKLQVQTGILFKTQDYLELVDATGRIQRTDKKGSITNTLPPIMSRLGFNLDDWLADSQAFEARLRYRHRSKLKKIV